MRKVIVLIALALSYGVNAQGLQAVKKYDLPVYLVETENYKVDLYPSGKFYYIYPKVTIDDTGLSRHTKYLISYQDYQDVVEFFHELIKAEPNAINYNYEIEGDNWCASIHKESNTSYGGYIARKHHGRVEGKQYLMFGDIKFLSSLPLDLEE